MEKSTGKNEQNEQKLREINNETSGIALSLEVMDGQMTFFSHLIQDCEEHPEGMASMLKVGELEKQLNAIYYLFHSQLKEIEKYKNEISKLSR